MGAVKPVRQLYGYPTALKSQYLAWDRYCTYVVQTPRVSGETNDISGTNKTHRSTRTTRGRPAVFDVNTKFAAEFIFCCA